MMKFVIGEGKQITVKTTSTSPLYEDESNMDLDDIF